MFTDPSLRARRRRRRREIADTESRTAQDGAEANAAAPAASLCSTFVDNVVPGE